MRLTVNDREQTLERSPETWGELLERLAEDAARRGEVVSAVRFDGADEPSFGDPAHAGRALATIGSIDVETAAPHALVDAALVEAIRTAGTLAAAVGSACALLRGPDVATANARLADLGEGLQALLATLTTVARVLEVDVARLAWNGVTVAEQVNELIEHVGAIIEAQRAGDWPTVADLLEYGVAPALATVRPVFDALRQACAASATGASDGLPAAPR